MRIRGRTAGFAVAALACVPATLGTVATTAHALSAHPLWHANSNRLTEGRLPGSEAPFVARGEMVLTSPGGIKIDCYVEEEGRVFNEGGRGLGEITNFNSWDCAQPKFPGECAGPLKPGLEPEQCPAVSFLTAEMPIEETLREAEACTRPATKLSDCPQPSEREAGNVISSYRRGASSLPWKIELASGVREEEPAYLLRTGLHEYGEAGSATEANTACYPKEGVVAAAYQDVPAGCVALNVVLTGLPAEIVFYGSQEVSFVNGAGNGLDASRLEFVHEGGTLFSSQGVQGTGSLSGTMKMFGAESQALIFAH